LSQQRIALSILAHPDDAEFVCAGTLALLFQKDWQIHIATVSPGNCGSAVLGPDEIAAIRRKEGVAAAAILNGKFHCRESEDCCIRHDKPTMLKAVEIIRKVKPTVIFTASPSDYLYDHEATSLIGRDATFWCSVPNIRTEDVEPLESIPHLYYCDPLDCENIFGEPINPKTIIDISSVIEIKAQMLASHASQRDWLLKQHGTDEYISAMKRLGQKRGKKINCEFAEGFRQHIGNAYPKDDILATELGILVRSAK